MNFRAGPGSGIGRRLTMKNEKLKEIGEYLQDNIDFAVTRFAEMMIEHQRAGMRG